MYYGITFILDSLKDNAPTLLVALAPLPLPVPLARLVRFCAGTGSDCSRLLGVPAKHVGKVRTREYESYGDYNIL